MGNDYKRVSVKCFTYSCWLGWSLLKKTKFPFLPRQAVFKYSIMLKVFRFSSTYRSTHTAWYAVTHFADETVQIVSVSLVWCVVEESGDQIVPVHTEASHFTADAVMLTSVVKTRNGEMTKCRNGTKAPLKSPSVEEYSRTAAMTLCFELQQSHKMDYQNRIHFGMNFTHDVWQTCTLHRNRVTLDVYIKYKQSKFCSAVQTCNLASTKRKQILACWDLLIY